MIILTLCGVVIWEGRTATSTSRAVDTRVDAYYTVPLVRVWSETQTMDRIPLSSHMFPAPDLNIIVHSPLK